MEPRRAHHRLNPTTAAASKLAGLAALVAFAAWLSLTAPQDYGRIAPIWPANAIVLACMLDDPKRWRSYLAAGFIGNFAGDLLAGDSFIPALPLAGCNTLELSLAFGLMRHVLRRPRFDPRRPRDLAALHLAAAVACPAAALVAATVVGVLRSGPFASTLVVWSLADALGLVIVTPAIFALRHGRRYLRDQAPSALGALSLLAFVTIAMAVFWQRSYPLLFVVSIGALAVAYTAGVVGTVFAVFVGASIAVLFTLLGHGPLTLVDGGWTERLLTLQLFLAVTSAVGLALAASNHQAKRHQERTARAAARTRRALTRLAINETRFRLLAENATDIIASFDTQARFTYLSPSVERILGYRPDELIGQPTRLIMHPDDYKASLEVYRDHVGPEEAGRGFEFEYRAYRKDGSTIWLSGRPRALHDRDGRLVGFQDVVRDVTAQKRLEAELREARRSAEAAAEAKGEFLANMSHELRTPLTAIIGFGGLLDHSLAKDGAQHTEYGRYAARITSAAKTLKATVDDILDFSRLEAGRLQLNVETVAVRTLLAEVADVMTGPAETKGLALQVHVAEDVPQALALDPARVRQVLYNLIGNAVKFTETGSVQVAVETSGTRIRFSVRDTGPGLSQADQAKLFQRFSQVDAGPQRRHGGTGLGLAICKGLVEMMGGELGVASQPGEGSLFWFTLPVSGPTAGSSRVA